MARDVHHLRHGVADEVADQETKSMSILPTADYFRGNVALRNDTLLGVCESIGRDVGFNPNFLRVPLAAGIIFAPLLMVGIYLALGALVFVSRALMPDRTVATTRQVPEETPVVANADVELPRAA